MLALNAWFAAATASGQLAWASPISQTVSASACALAGDACDVPVAEAAAIASATTSAAGASKRSLIETS